jgi:hypothetical protein
MDYNIFSPIIQDEDNAKVSKGRSQGHNRVFNDKGVFYVGGMGCHICDNCFECPLHEQGKDCQFNLNPKDLKYTSNRGNGIKVW